MAKKNIDIACAIIERERLVLAAQRSSVMSMPLKWEFPGGKIKPGETAWDCLEREIMGVLGVTIRITKQLPVSTHEYPAFQIAHSPFVCEISSGALSMKEHAALVWLPPQLSG